MKRLLIGSLFGLVDYSDVATRHSKNLLIACQQVGRAVHRLNHSMASLTADDEIELAALLFRSG